MRPARSPRLVPQGRARRGPLAIQALMLLSLALFVMSGCMPATPSVARTPGPTQPASPSSATPAPSSPAAGPLSQAELKYRLIDQYGPLFFCDPDEYPVARELTQQYIDQRFAEIQQNGEEFQAILQHLGLQGTTTFTAEQKDLVYAQHKQLNAVLLQPADGRYHFSLRQAQGAKRALAVEGTIDRRGITSEVGQRSVVAACPICLAANTRIATPLGAVRVQDLRIGSPVWTAGAEGKRQPAVVVRLAGRPVPPDALLTQVVLSDGRRLVASPGHPTADGRTLGSLEAGDTLDGVVVVSVSPVPYAGRVTYDLLPSGPNGSYWADGVLVGSTLAGTGGARR